jgi:hypothetical protein
MSPAQYNKENKMSGKLFDPTSEDRKKDGFTDITVILDRSGSMHDVVEETISGFNKFLEEQRNLDGKAKITLVQFDDHYDVVYQDKDIKKANLLNTKTFVPRGNTALLDAIGKTIATKQETFSKTEDKPDNVVMVIITDGAENASTEYAPNKINETINKLKDDWRFVFLGANQDAIATARNLGIRSMNAASYTGSGRTTKLAYNAVSHSIGQMRAGGMSVNTNFFSSQVKSALMDDNSAEPKVHTKDSTADPSVGQTKTTTTSNPDAEDEKDK